VKKKSSKGQNRSDALRREYDFSDGVRAKYVTRLRSRSNIVLLSPEVAKYFPDEKSVNTALRKLINATKATRRREG
jgi:hypothetical protein